MKIVNSQIDVVTAPGKEWIPVAILWRGGRMEVVGLLDFWVVQTSWWLDEVRRIYLRLNTEAGVIEVYRSRDEWVLYRVFD